MQIHANILHYIELAIFCSTVAKLGSIPLKATFQTFKKWNETV